MDQHDFYYNKSSYLCRLFNIWQTSLTLVSLVYNIQDGSESSLSLKSSPQYMAGAGGMGGRGEHTDTSLALKNSYDYIFLNLAVFTYIRLYKIAHPPFINETAISCL